MGFSNFWIGIFSVALIVVTSHDAFVDCWLFNLPFRVFAMSIPLSSSMRWVFISEILCWCLCTFVLGFYVGLYVSVSCVIHDVQVEMFGVFVLVVIQNENEWYNLYISDILMGGINILVGMGGEYSFYPIDLDWYWWALDGGPRCERYMACLIKVLCFFKT